MLHKDLLPLSSVHTPKNAPKGPFTTKQCLHPGMLQKDLFTTKQCMGGRVAGGVAIMAVEAIEL